MRASLATALLGLLAAATATDYGDNQWTDQSNSWCSKWYSEGKWGQYANSWWWCVSRLHDDDDGPVLETPFAHPMR